MNSIKAFLAAAVAVIMPAAQVFAEGISSPAVEISQELDAFTVYAKTEAVDHVMIQIIEKEDTPGADAPIIAFDEVDVSGKGEFTHTLELANPIGSGRYYIYISGLTQPIEKWCLTDADRQTLTEEIYNTSNEPEHKKALFADGDSTMFEYAAAYDRADLLSLKTPLYNDSYDDCVSAILYPIKTNDYTVLKRNFSIASAIAAFNVDEFNRWVDQDTKKLTTKIWDDETLMGKAQKHYNKTLSKTGRENVISYVRSKIPYTTLEAFNEMFAKAVMYNGVYNQNASLAGYGHFYDLISELEEVLKDNDVNKVKIAKYKALSADKRAMVESKLLNGTASDFEEMCFLMEQYVKEVSTSGGTTEKTHTGTGSGGGGVNLVLPSAPEPYIPGTASTEFDDIDTVEWAREAIKVLKDKGIVSGVGGGKFEPNRAVKREEFIKILLAALDIEVGDADSGFSDVDNNEWYAPYIARASELGITSGMGDGSFGVGTPITREQCCTFICRACAGRSFEGKKKAFNDADEISEYAKEYVESLSRAGIIVGDENGKFNPTDNLTRAQAAVMIYRLIMGGNK